MIRKMKRKKWDKKNLVSPEEKRRDLKIYKQETKKYRGIEYNLISLESYSGRKWVSLESEFEFPKDILYDLREKFDFMSDFLWYDSISWDKYPIAYQWKKMDKIAKQEIDDLYKLHDNIDTLLKGKMNNLTKIITNLKDFIKNLESE